MPDDWKTVDPGDWQTVGSGSPSTKPIPPAKKGPGLLGGIYRGSIGGLVDTAKLGAKVTRAMLTPWDTDYQSKLRHEIADPQIDLFKQAGADFKRGDPITGLAHGFLGAVPFAGPAVNEMSEEVASGNIRGPLGTGIGMALTAGLGKGLGKARTSVLPKAAHSLYEGELSPSAKISLPNREAMVKRGLGTPGQPGVPIAKSSLPELERASLANKRRIDSFTKDPASPYSQRTIPKSSILSPLDSYISRVLRVDPAMAKQLTKLRTTWEKQLGSNPNASVFDVQRLKDAYTNPSAYNDPSSPAPVVKARKLAARGMQKGIESAIPEEPVGAINKAISTDLKLKDAITSAIKRKPSWIRDFAPFVLGYAAESLIKGGPGSGAEGLLAGLVVREAIRKPAIMSRLAIALNKAGVTDVPLPGAGKVAGVAGAVGTITNSSTHPPAQ